VHSPSESGHLDHGLASGLLKLSRRQLLAELWVQIQEVRPVGRGVIIPAAR
jgi:hypothetical protein